MQGSYRPEIDGLRAIAILSVLFYHLGTPGFGGGFVGVDVFFVISGFLIGGIVIRDMDRGTFRILHFYERRARRILPALFAMIAAVLAISCVALLPADLDAIPLSAIAAVLSVSNLWFWHDNGYFVAAESTRPLLHSWSLGVEEQFYLGFPLFLLVVARPRRRALWLSAAAVASFALVWRTREWSDGFAFYLSPTRAWELLAGVLLALAPIAELGRTTKTLLAAGGLVAIAVAVALFSSTMTYPGLAVLLPVLGSVALIASGSGHPVADGLSRPLVAGIGRISYSLYLWHWPVIVFSGYGAEGPPGLLASTGIIAVSLALAWLSWRWIETPFRDPRRLGARALWASALTAAVMLCLGAIAILALQGWPERFSQPVLALAAARTDISPLRKACADVSSDQVPVPCVLGNAARADTLVWGDSHGVELAYALAERPEMRGHGLIEATTSSCPPLIGYPGLRASCNERNLAVVRRLQHENGIHTIVLAGFWTFYAGSQPAALPQALERTIAALRRKGRTVILVGPVPPLTFDAPRRLAAMAAVDCLPEAQGPSRADFEQRMAAFNAVVARASGEGFVFIDPNPLFCPGARCRLMADGQPLYFDTNHPSLSAARRIAAIMAPHIAN